MTIFVLISPNISNIHVVDGQEASKTIICNVCTDKDHYHEGDTVTVYGNAGIHMSVDIKLFGHRPQKTISGIIILPQQFSTEIGTVKTNDEGTFTTSFILQGNYYAGSGAYEVSVEYKTSSAASGVMPVGDSTFTAGDIVENLNPFQIIINKTASGLQTFAIVVPDNQKYSAAVGNRVQVITRLTNPEGQISFINNPYPAPNFAPISGGNLNWMYGRWTVQTTWGDNISTVTIDVPRPPPTVLIFLDKTSYVKTEKIGFHVSVIDKIPRKTDFTYQITDPIGNIILSNGSSLSYTIGTVTDDNVSGLPTVSNDIFIPTDSFPKVDGNYTIQVNYQGSTKTASFGFVNYSTEFEQKKTEDQIQSIMSNFSQSLNDMGPWVVKQYVGESEYDKVSNITSENMSKSNQASLFLELSRDSLKAIIWHTDSLKAQFENEINTLNIPTDRKSQLDQQIENQAELAIHGGLSSMNQYITTVISDMAGQNLQPFDEQDLRSEVARDIANNPSLNSTNMIQQPALIVNTTSTARSNLTSVTSSIPTTSSTIPNWIRNNAKWWSSGSISDSDFTKGLQYLIQNKIMSIQQVQPTSHSAQIPVWVKNAAGWWSDGKISDDEFVRAMQYLVQIGIIQLKS
jgi:hypothetical protein